MIVTGLAESPDKNRGIFSERAAETGIDFVHFNGMSGEFYYCEMVGGGGALFDYDNDGDLDAYIVQGSMLGAGKTLADAIFPPATSSLTDRLYRNDLVMNPDGTTRLRFTDVTPSSGLRALGYGMGAAAADFNNDGWVDLYVINFGPNQMFQNNGDGTFTDVTQKTGTGNENWGVSAAFLDFDRDGWLDLFLGNYVDFRFSNRNECHSASGAVDYCGPLGYQPVPNRLFRNNGDGTFTDVTGATGTDDPRWSVSAAFLDYDRDGWLDLYVGNYVNFSFSNHKLCFSFGNASSKSAREYCDPSRYEPLPESLFHNRGDGTFEDVSRKSGIAGQSNGALGVSSADFNGDGWIDIYVANDKRPNHLWINQKDGRFRNEALVSGCAVSGEGFAESSMGVDAGDFDNDGDEDLFMTHMSLNEKNTLYRNNGKGWFEDVSYPSGLALPSVVFTGFGTAFSRL